MMPTIKPIKPKIRSLAAFRASQVPLDPLLSQTIAEDREDRC